MKSEDVGLIVRAISFKNFLTYVVLIHQRHRRTDDMRSQDCALH